MLSRIEVVGAPFFVSTNEIRRLLPVNYPAGGRIEARVVAGFDFESGYRQKARCSPEGRAKPFDLRLVLDADHTAFACRVVPWGWPQCP